MVRLALALVLLLPAAAAAESQRAVSGDVTAEITWVAGKDRPPHGLRVTIERAGRKLVDDHVGDGPAFPQIRKAVRVRDLDGDHEPEVATATRAARSAARYAAASCAATTAPTSARSATRT